MLETSELYGPLGPLHSLTNACSVDLRIVTRLFGLLFVVFIVGFSGGKYAGV